jgi:hypothetical protein
MTSEEGRALRVARPNVGIWLDKLRRSGHVVFVRQFQLGAKPKDGYRIVVDGQKMTVWGLWARFRSELGEGSGHIRAEGSIIAAARSNKSIMRCNTRRSPVCAGRPRRCMLTAVGEQIILIYHSIETLTLTLTSARRKLKADRKTWSRLSRIRTRRLTNSSPGLVTYGRNVPKH